MGGLARKGRRGRQTDRQTKYLKDRILISGKSIEMPANRTRGRSGRLRRPAPLPRGNKMLRRRLGVGYNKHVFKRRCATIIVGLDSNNIPTLIQDGNGAMSLGNQGVGILSNTAQFGMSYNAQLKHAVEYTDFTQLFDRYKITGVKLRVQYQNNMGDPNSHCLPGLSSAWDGDDANVPSSKEDVTRKIGAKTSILNANRSFSIFLRPRVTKSVYQQGLTSAYTSERSCYIDCSNPSVDHYGYKFWIDSWLATPGAQSGQILSIEPTLYLSMKDVQ